MPMQCKQYKFGLLDMGLESCADWLVLLYVNKLTWFYLTHLKFWGRGQCIWEAPHTPSGAL